MTNNNIWANAYWNFFHILSCNLNENILNNKNLKLIHLFINNLINSIPCEKCKIDTVQYFENNNFNNIKKKKDFIIFFYLFHNYVNSKTGKTRENINILNTYSNLNIIKHLLIIDRTIYSNTISKNVYKFFLMITKV